MHCEQETNLFELDDSLISAQPTTPKRGDRMRFDLGGNQRGSMDWKRLEVQMTYHYRQIHQTFFQNATLPDDHWEYMDDQITWWTDYFKLPYDYGYGYGNYTVVFHGLDAQDKIALCLNATFEVI